MAFGQRYHLLMSFRMQKGYSFQPRVIPFRNRDPPNQIVFRNIGLAPTCQAGHTWLQAISCLGQEKDKTLRARDSPSRERFMLHASVLYGRLATRGYGPYPRLTKRVIRSYFPRTSPSTGCSFRLARTENDLRGRKRLTSNIIIYIAL
ncbi:hypothetical protein BJY01DRAFT_42395 [Aspergillus pseudoustus]|uniref:Uncharacterized protein n=1 Tax=Aspergillus pseudoustus TaxID=1810923 RepID=A0ABR4JBS9_9EURO